MAKAKKQQAAYDEHRDDMAEYSRQKSAAGRDIGDIPPVANTKRRNKCVKSLRLFLETYFPDTFGLEWSEDHLAMIQRIETCVIHGGLFCSAMPRGSGKTSVTIRAALWAMLAGHRRFVIMLGATERLAEKMIAVLRSELQFNELMLEDFPEVCFPIRCLENEVRRQAGQTINGENTMIRFAADEIVLPTVKKSKASGAIIRACGLTGAVRGQIATTASGQTIRPDLVLADDPQSRESAKSPTQTQEREDLINADVIGLAGPGQEIACVMNCTVIYKNDLSDRYLNTDKNPAWGGRRAKLLYELPKNLELWDEYADIGRNSLRELGNNTNGNTFYRERQAEMDAGAKPGWPARFNKDELSAIQNAMNIKIDRPRAFASEYQNDPDSDALAQGAKELNADAIAMRLSGVDKMVVPHDCSTVTTFIDAGGYLHWYMVVAWNHQMGGSVIDYGCWPRQNRTHFVASDARPKLADVYKGGNPERVFAGLVALVAELAGRRYIQERTNAEVRCERMMVDSGFETKAVYDFIKQLNAPGMIVLPSKGFGRSATQVGIAGWKKRPGERHGYHWRLGVSETGRGQSVQYDTDAWKSFVYERLTMPLGGPQVITLYGKDHRQHGLLSEHLSSEFSEPVQMRGVTFDKWKVLPDRGENHWFDCLTGAAVAASVQGLQWTANVLSVGEEKKSKPISLKELQQQRRAEKERLHRV